MSHPTFHHISHFHPVFEPEPWAVDLFSTVAFLEETKKEAALWEARVAAIAETCGADLAGSTTGADLPPDLAGRGGPETAEETAEASWKGFGTAMEAARLERLTLPDDAPRAARIIAERMRSSRPVVLTNLAALAGFAPEVSSRTLSHCPPPPTLPYPPRDTPPGNLPP